jgi:hypothetical protein
VCGRQVAKGEVRVDQQVQPTCRAQVHEHRKAARSASDCTPASADLRKLVNRHISSSTLGKNA